MESASRQLPDGFTPQSYPCPANHIWDAQQQKCIAISLRDYAHPCPKGYIYDADLQDCVYDPSVQIPDTEHTRPSCASGTTWNRHLQMCVRDNTNPGTLVAEYDFTEDYSDYGASSGQIVCNGSSNQFYFAFPGRSHYFIQCDQAGTMHVQFCGKHRVWNDEIKTCVHHLLEYSNGNNQNAVERSLGNDIGDDSFNRYGITSGSTIGHTSTTSASDLCKGKDGTYHAYPGSPRIFIMCYNNMGHMMSCPLGSQWQDSIAACNWKESSQ